MSIQVFGILFLFGASAIALWLDARFPGLAPADLRRAILRTLIALGASQLIFPPVWAAALARSPVLLAVFVVAFPCLTWVLLSAIWSIRQLQATLRGHMP
jgi:hypothetical protein